MDEFQNSAPATGPLSSQRASGACSLRNRLGAKSIISLAVLLAVVAGILFYLYSHPQLIRSVLNISPWNALLLLMMSLLSLGANGLYHKIISSRFGIDLRPKEWFGLAAVTVMGNYVTPFSGGLVARAAYLKHRHDFPYAHFMAILAANYMISFSVISVAGIILMFTLAGTENFSWPVLSLFLAALSAILLVSSLPSIRTGGDHRLLRLIRAALEGLDVIRRDGGLLWKLVALTFFNVMVGAFLFYVVFLSIGAAIPFRLAFLIYLLTSFSVLINITPGNLGVQEVVTSLAAAILGAGAEFGLLASLVIRAITLLSAFTLGPIFSYVLSKELIASRKDKQKV